MKKILVIDDVRNNLKIIKETLEDLIPDCMVLTTQTGKEGLEIAKEEQPDTIITDMIMPGMNGCEICKKISEDKELKHIPVVILSGSKTDTESRIKCLEAGADVFLSKPIDAAELTAQINVMLRIKEAEDKLRAERELLDEKVKERTEELRLEIAERKQSVEALSESEKKYRTLTENVNIGIYRNSAGQKGRFIEVNPAFVKIFGYDTKEEILRLNVSNLYQNPKDRLAFNNKLIEKGFVNNKEIFLKRKDGSPIICLVSASVIKDKKGNIVFFDGIIEDITERKRVEQALQQSEELYRTMIEHSNDMIWTLDLKGNFLYINKKSEEVVGRSAKSEIGNSFVPLIVEEDLKMVEKVFMETLKGKSLHYEVRIHNSNRTKIITLSVNTAPIKKDGKVIGTVSFGRDITTRNKAEADIRKRMSEIETFNRLAVGREMRMIDLKKEINELLKKTGKEPKYKIAK